jgi:hypothetical protein
MDVSEKSLTPFSVGSSSTLKVTTAGPSNILASFYQTTWRSESVLFVVTTVTTSDLATRSKYEHMKFINNSEIQKWCNVQLFNGVSDVSFMLQSMFYGFTRPLRLTLIFTNDIISKLVVLFHRVDPGNGQINRCGEVEIAALSFFFSFSNSACRSQGV